MYTRKTTGLKQLASGFYKKNDKAFFIRCSISGLLYPCSADRIPDLLKKYKDYASIAANFIGRHSKSLLNAGMSKDKIADLEPEAILEESKGLVEHKKEKQVKAKAEKVEKPDRVFAPIIYNPKMTHENLLDSPQSIGNFTKQSGCIRPDFFLNHGRRCGGCQFVNDCRAGCKDARKKYNTDK